jgi:hypothetical protein
MDIAAEGPMAGGTAYKKVQGSLGARDALRALSRAGDLPLSFLFRQIGERHDRIAACS